MHFLEMQARLGLQSAFKTHSGLQLGGLPIMLGRHEHWQLSPRTLGILEFGPQGLGSQGSSAIIGSVAKSICDIKFLLKINHLLTELNKCAGCEGVSLISLLTCAGGNVIDNFTIGMCPT